MRLSVILGYLKPYTKHCIMAPLFKFIEAVLELFLPLVMANVIDKGAARGDAGYVLGMGAVMLLIVTVGLGCSLVCQYMASVASQGFGTVLRNAVFERINRLSHTQIDRLGIPSLINRVTGDTQQLQYAVAMLLRLVVRAPFLCIGGIIMALTIDPGLSLVVIAAIPLFLIVIILVMRLTVRLHRTVQNRLDKLTLILRENLSGVRVIRAFTRTKQEQKRFSASVDQHTQASLGAGVLSALLNPATQLIMNAAIVAIVWFGGIRVNAGGMSTGEVIAFINYVNMILLALMVVSNLVITFTKAYTSAGRVAEVLATQPAVSDSQHLVENPSSKAPAVAFSHVYFSYNDNQNDQYDLTDINAVIPKGATVGVIGGTGAGKSTLMNLIMRFFDVQSGEVQVDGINVTHYPMETLRSKIGLVPQKSELFSATIAQNIRWGKPDASDQEVRNAAAAAQALEFIERQPDGFDAMVERGGANLSGGQKQRLSIARALVRRPEILILDDASSALDYATDAALRRSIRAMSKAREMTIFMVSQRVGTIQHADMILVMDDGYLKGVGTHQQLLASCEVYREICSVQLS